LASGSRDISTQLGVNHRGGVRAILNGAINDLRHKKHLNGVINLKSRHKTI
jgi:hypothetical protein